MSFSNACKRLIRARLLLLPACLIAAAASLSGCASGSPDSDIPWNVPQRWEGTPALPSGFQQQ